jgi:CBS domain-containing protein
MGVKEIMTANPKCCTPETKLAEVARLMVECDCGEIPVVQTLEKMKPVGVVTDRDIICRLVAQGKNPVELCARDCMTSPVVTVRPDMSAEECCKLMEKHQIRRVPVVDEHGQCCGIVSQADLAKNVPMKLAQVVREVSTPASSRPTLQV